MRRKKEESRKYRIFDIWIVISLHLVSLCK